MGNLIKFIIKYHFVILFILLEILSFSFLVKYNNYQKAKFVKSCNSISASINGSVSNLTNYLSLKEVNEELIKENTFLKNKLKSSYSFQDSSVIKSKLYEYRYAKVINNTVNKMYNYIIIDKGALDGIKNGMGVVTPNGLVGIVCEVSDNASTIISLLNQKVSFSAKIKKNNYPGSLMWKGKNYKQINLKDIYYHVDITKGDTIVSGNSLVFPPNIFIGTVKNVKRSSGENTFDIKINLAIDFKRLSYVYVIDNILKPEIDEMLKKVSVNK